MIEFGAFGSSNINHTHPKLAAFDATIAIPASTTDNNFFITHPPLKK